MFYRYFSMIFLLSIFLHANSSFGSITTGSQKGTYIKIGKDIAAVCKKYKADLQVVSSKGSIGNLDILVGKNVTQKASWAIVQNDALDFYRFSHFKDTREDLNEKVKALLPLYSEHIHVFAKKGNQVKFQRGGFLKVGLSSRKSGAAITAHILENAYGIRFKYVYSGFEEAKKYLKDGVIDIYIDVIALPSKKYTKLSGLELVELPQNDKVKKIYISTTFSKKQYPWLSKNVKGFKVPSVLVTNLTKEKYNQTVGVFLKVILTNYKLLMQKGNPKWKEAYANRKFPLENMHPVAKKLLSK